MPACAPLSSIVRPPMKVRAISVVSVAVVAGAVVLALATLWHEYPGSGKGCTGDCWIVLSPLEYLLKIAVGFVAIVGVAVTASKTAARRKVLVSTVACALSGIIALFILGGAIARI